MQSTKPIEVLVVDDTPEGLDQVTLKQMTDFGLPVTYLSEPAQNGLGTAGRSRNIGAARAMGIQLAFLDDDDEWSPDFLSTCARTLLSRRTDMAVAWTRQVRDGRVLGQLRIPEGLQSKDCLGRNPGLTGSNFVIQRSAFEKIGGFDTTLRVGNDQDFFVRFLDAGLMYSVAAHDLVVQLGHGRGQLTSPTEARAIGLEAYRDKWLARLDRKARRQLRFSIHSVRRHSAASRRARIGHLVGELANADLSDIISSVGKVIAGKRGAYR